MSSALVRKRKYNDRLYWELVDLYPERVSASDVPTIAGIELHWSRRHIGMMGRMTTGPASVLTLVTGQPIMLHKSMVSVASFRLRVGTATGVSVRLTGLSAWKFMDAFIYRVMPRYRPFTGYSLDCIDSGGNLTVPRVNPLAFSEVESYYDRFHVRASRPGRSMTVHTNAFKAGGSVDRIRERGVSLLSGLGIKFKS